jgi:predicted porin
MKKSLFAVAAATAFAGAAQAQSSVTVYGIIDAGYIGGSSRVTSSNGLGATGGTLKTTVNQFGQSAETTSRLGFRGNEDLGGGLSAFFTAEFQLQPQDQVLSGNATGGLVNRQTFVGLAKKGLGNFALGTQYTPVFNASAATDPGQHNNMLGNVIYAGAAVVGIKEADNGTVSAGFTNRTSNTLTIATDTFAGAKFSAMYTLNNTNTSAGYTGSTATGGQTNADGWGLRAEYTLQKFYATAAYQSLKQYTWDVTAATSRVLAQWQQQLQLQLKTMLLT